MLPRPPGTMARSCLARTMASTGKIRPTLGSSSRKGPGTAYDLRIQSKQGEGTQPIPLSMRVKHEIERGNRL
jgi:hypothetical protein